MTEKELDLIRQGKMKIKFGIDGSPVPANASLFERMRFLMAAAHGYNVLYERVKSQEKKGCCMKNTTL